MISRAVYDSTRAGLLGIAQYREIGNDIIFLLQDRVANALDMRFLGVHMNSNSLHKLRRLVQTNQILALVVPPGDPVLRGGDGIYLQELDVLFVRAGRHLADLFLKSSIFHELVHARLDMQGRETSELRDETAAYVYQAMYLQRSGVVLGTLPQGSDTQLLSSAFRIADCLLSHRAVAGADVQALQAAIRRLPIYSRRNLGVIHNNAVRH